VTVELLPLAVAERRRREPFTYDEIGRTAGILPEGFSHLRETRVLRSVDLESATRALMSWQLHTRAGLRVSASGPTVEREAVVLLRIGKGPARITAPCRVVYVVEEDDRRGFAHGTLPGHPESGEEAFIVTRQPEGAVRLEITAFSRPATPLSRLGGPAAGLVQRRITRRYLRSLDGGAR
jgi:uncharacterized protein (UPF0548 family)